MSDGARLSVRGEALELVFHYERKSSSTEELLERVSRHAFLLDALDGELAEELRDLSTEVIAKRKTQHGKK